MSEKKYPLCSKRYIDIPEGRWTKKLCIHEFPLPEGKTGRWESLDVGETPTVLLCGLTESKELILVNMFRFPVQTFCTELPGGTVDPNEVPEDAVFREFLEETGYQPKKVKPLCKGFLWNGKSSGRFEVWLGEGCEKVSEIELDAVEQYAQLEVLVMSIPEVKKLIASGDISMDPPISHALIALEAQGLI